MATVTGSGSQWNNSNSLFLGGSSTTDGGMGTLNIQDSGQVNVGNDLYTGSYTGSNTALTISDSGSSGNLWVRNGSRINNDGFGVIGYNATGVATVTGSGSQWINWGSLYVGDAGNGTLNVEAGGLVSNTFGLIGNSSSSTGVATVTGSQWNNSVNLWVGYSGNGTLNVEAGS